MICRICGRVIAVLIFRGTKLCCDMCRKIDNKELSTDEAVTFLISVSPDKPTPWELNKLERSTKSARKRAAKMRAVIAGGKEK